MIEKMMQAIDYGYSETDIYLQFTSFHQQADCVRLTCSLYTEDEEEKVMDQWLIECWNFQEYRLDSLDSYDREEFEVTDDHPYLWDYQKPFTELYFRGEMTDAKALIGDLYLEHNRLTNRLIPFGRYLNDEETGYGGNLEWLLTRKEGLFSTAPALLNEAYHALLSQYGFATSLLTRKAEPPCKECRLLRLGKSFVIAEKFDAIRIEAGNWFL
ncbi:hypothetical protein ACSFXN_07100 [Planococcus sp. 1R117A]|uniref:hypothetical protein n=1 Tax=Planococcus sp. 1R117A TaxID=3447020 RepID=UPI003EDB8BC3